MRVDEAYTYAEEDTPALRSLLTKTTFSSTDSLSCVDDILTGQLGLED